MRNSLFLCVLLASAPVGAEDWVRGLATVDGDSVAFEHVYTYYRPNSIFEAKWDLCALFSDVQIPADAIPSSDSGFSNCLDLMRADKVHALEVSKRAVPRGAQRLPGGAESSFVPQRRPGVPVRRRWPWPRHLRDKRPGSHGPCVFPSFLAPVLLHSWIRPQSPR